MAGGLLQLITIGEQDKIFFDNPQLSFFKIVYKRTTNFSLDSVKQIINLKFDQNNIIKISKVGDLLKNITIKIDIPNISCYYTKTIDDNINTLLDDNTFYFTDKVYYYNKFLYNIISSYINYISNLFNKLNNNYNESIKDDFIPFNDYIVYINNNYELDIIYPTLSFGNILKIKPYYSNKKYYINRNNSSFINQRNIFNSNLLKSKDLSLDNNVKIITFKNNIYNIINEYYKNLDKVSFENSILQIPELNNLNTEIMNNIINISIKDSIIALPINILLDKIDLYYNKKITNQYDLFNRLIIYLNVNIISNDEIYVIDQITNFKTNNSLNDNMIDSIDFYEPPTRYLFEINLDNYISINKTELGLELNINNNMNLNNNHYLIFEKKKDISDNEYYLYTINVTNIENNFSLQNISILSDKLNNYNIDNLINKINNNTNTFYNKLYVFFNQTNYSKKSKQVFKIPYKWYQFNKVYELISFHSVINNNNNKQFFKDYINAYIIIKFNPNNSYDIITDDVIGTIIFIYNNVNSLLNNINLNINMNTNLSFNDKYNILRKNPLFTAQVLSYQNLNNNTYKLNLYLGTDFLYDSNDNPNSNFYILNNSIIPISKIKYIKNTDVDDKYKHFDVVNLVNFVYNIFSNVNYTNRQLNNLVYNNLSTVLSENLSYINNLMNFIFNSVVSIRSTITYNNISKVFKSINQDYDINSNLLSYFNNILIGTQVNGKNNYANSILYDFNNILYNYQISISNSFKSIPSSIDSNSIDVVIKRNDYIKNIIKSPIIMLEIPNVIFDINTNIVFSGNDISQNEWNKLKFSLCTSPFTAIPITIQKIYKLFFTGIKKNYYEQIKTLTSKYILKTRNVSNYNVSHFIIDIELNNIDSVIITVYTSIDITDTVTILNQKILNNEKIEFLVYDTNLLLLNKFGVLTLTNPIEIKQSLFLVCNDSDNQLQPLNYIPFIKYINNIQVDKIKFISDFWYSYSPLDSYFNTYVPLTNDNYLHYFYLQMIMDICHLVVSDINNNYINNPMVQFISYFYYKLYYYNHKALLDFQNQIINADSANIKSNTYYFYNILPSALINSSNELIDIAENHLEYIYYLKYTKNDINYVLTTINIFDFVFINYNNFTNFNTDNGSTFIDINSLDFYDKIYYIYYLMIQYGIKYNLIYKSNEDFSYYDIRHYYNINTDTNTAIRLNNTTIETSYYFINFSHITLFNKLKEAISIILVGPYQFLSLTEVITQINNYNTNNDNNKILFKSLLQMLLHYLYIIFNSKNLLLNKTININNNDIILDNYYLLNIIDSINDSYDYNEKVSDIEIIDNVLYDKVSDRIFNIYWNSFTSNSIYNLSYYTPFIKVIDSNYKSYITLITDIYNIKFSGKYSYDNIINIERFFNINIYYIIKMNNISSNWSNDNNRNSTFYLRKIEINTIPEYIQYETINITDNITKYENNKNILKLKDFLIPNDIYYSDNNFGYYIILNEVLSNFNTIQPNTPLTTEIIEFKDEYNITDKKIFCDCYNLTFFDISLITDTFKYYITILKNEININNIYTMLMTYTLSNSIFSKYKSISTIVDISNYNRYLTNESNQLNLLYNTINNTDYKIINIFNKKLVIFDTYIETYLQSFFDISKLNLFDSNINNIISYQRKKQLLKYNYVKTSDKIFDIINNIKSLNSSQINIIKQIDLDSNIIKQFLLNRINLYWINNDINYLNPYIDSNFMLINGKKYFYFMNVLMNEIEYYSIKNLTYDYINGSIGINDFIYTNYITDNINNTAKIFRKTDLPTGYFFKYSDNIIIDIDTIYKIDNIWLVIYNIISNLMSIKYFDDNLINLSINLNQSILYTNEIFLDDYNIYNYNKLCKITLIDNSTKLLFIDNISYKSKQIIIDKVYNSNIIIYKLYINNIEYNLNTDYIISSIDNLYKFTFNNNYIDVSDFINYSNMNINIKSYELNEQSFLITKVNNSNYTIIIGLEYFSSLIISKVYINNILYYPDSYIKDPLTNYTLLQFNQSTFNNFTINTQIRVVYNNLYNKDVNIIDINKSLYYFIIDIEYYNGLIIKFPININIRKADNSFYTLIQFDSNTFNNNLNLNDILKIFTNYQITYTQNITKVNNIRSILSFKTNIQLNLKQISFGINNIFLNNNLNIIIHNTNYTLNDIYNIIDLDNIITLFNKLKNIYSLINTIYDKYDSLYLTTLDRNFTISDIFYNMMKDIVTTNIKNDFDENTLGNSKSSQFIITPYNIFEPDNLVKDKLDIKYLNKLTYINDMDTDNDLLLSNRNILLDTSFNKIIYRDFYPKFKFIYFLGDFIINNISWWINASKIEELNNYFIHIFNHLHLDDNINKLKAKYNLIGHTFDNINLTTSKNAFSLWINIPFSFTQHNGLALPMIALTQDIILHINLLSINDFIIKDDDIELNFDNSIKSSLYLDNVYLDVDERKLFGMSRHEYLLKLPIIQDTLNINNNLKQDIPIMINYPTSDLFIFTQNNNSILNKEYYNFTTDKYIPFLDTSIINNFFLFEKYYNLYNDDRFKKWYEYANNYYNLNYLTKNNILTGNIFIDKSQFYTKYNNNKLYTLLLNHPNKFDKLVNDLMNNFNYDIDKNVLLDNISLTVNSKKRFDCNKDILLDIYNYQYYNHNIKGLYTFSFGLNTKELQPSGSLNFCYLNKPFITISTNPNITNNNTNINIIGRVYNILRVMSGQGSLTYE